MNEALRSVMCWLCFFFIVFKSFVVKHSHIYFFKLNQDYLHMQFIDLSGNFDFSETNFGDIITSIFAKTLHASLEITFRNIEHTYYSFQTLSF